MKKIVMLMVVSALGFSGALLANGNGNGNGQDKDKDNYDEVCGAVIDDIGGHGGLTTALGKSVFSNAGTNSDGIVGTNGGFDLNMWATVVATDGTVCAVTKTGAGLNDQWLGSRVISA